MENRLHLLQKIDTKPNIYELSLRRQKKKQLYRFKMVPLGQQGGMGQGRGRKECRLLLLVMSVHGQATLPASRMEM